MLILWLNWMAKCSEKWRHFPPFESGGTPLFFCTVFKSFWGVSKSWGSQFGASLISRWYASSIGHHVGVSKTSQKKWGYPTFYLGRIAQFLRWGTPTIFDTTFFQNLATKSHHERSAMKRILFYIFWGLSTTITGRELPHFCFMG